DKLVTGVQTCALPISVSQLSASQLYAEYVRFVRVFTSWPKPLPILTRSDEGLHHLSIDVVAVELIQLRQPKLVARMIRVRQIVRSEERRVGKEGRVGW